MINRPVGRGRVDPAVGSFDCFGRMVASLQSVNPILSSSFIRRRREQIARPGSSEKTGRAGPETPQPHGSLSKGWGRPPIRFPCSTRHPRSEEVCARRGSPRRGRRGSRSNGVKAQVVLRRRPGPSPTQSFGLMGVSRPEPLIKRRVGFRLPARFVAPGFSGGNLINRTLFITWWADHRVHRALLGRALDAKTRAARSGQGRSRLRDALALAVGSVSDVRSPLDRSGESRGSETITKRRG